MGCLLEGEPVRLNDQLDVGAEVLQVFGDLYVKAITQIDVYVLNRLRTYFLYFST